MLLTELTGVKAYHSKTGEEILKALEDAHGIKVLGKGRFAVTLGHPSWDYVIKVFPRDDCYVKFLDFVSRNQPNINLPKIIMKPKKMTTFFRRNSGHDTFYVAKIEKLEDLNREDYKELKPMFEHNFFRLAADAIKADSFDRFLKSHGLSRGIHGNLVETIVKITQDGDADCFTDVHFQNIMRRRDGTFVVTDPLGGHTDVEAEMGYMQLKKFSQELSTFLDTSGIWGKPVQGPVKKDQLSIAADFLSKAMK